MKKILYVGLLSGFVALQANAQNLQLKQIEVEGLQRVEKATVLSYLNLKKKVFSILQ